MRAGAPKVVGFPDAGEASVEAEDGSEGQGTGKISH